MALAVIQGAVKLCHVLERFLLREGDGRSIDLEPLASKGLLERRKGAPKGAPSAVVVVFWPQ